MKSGDIDLSHERKKEESQEAEELLNYSNRKSCKRASKFSFDEQKANPLSLTQDSALKGFADTAFHLKEFFINQG